MSDQRVIKKYPNRRLYDTTKSQYIKLEDIRDLVVKRVEFVVNTVWFREQFGTDSDDELEDGHS